MEYQKWDYDNSSINDGENFKDVKNIPQAEKHLILNLLMFHAVEDILK